ncbi:hypothetical protein GIHI108528_07360 [Gillisia hiemivivida]
MLDNMRIVRYAKVESLIEGLIPRGLPEKNLIQAGLPRIFKSIFQVIPHGVAPRFLNSNLTQI